MITPTVLVHTPVLLGDLRTTASGTFPEELTVHGSRVYYSFEDRFGDRELWSTDGTASGTGKVKDIHPQGASDPQSLFSHGSLLYFSAQDGTHGREPWVSDGTEAGTYLLADINPGEGSSNPTSFVSFNGKVYFRAHDGTEYAVWEADATGVTKLLAGGGVPLGVVANRLYFHYDDGIDGDRLWVMDVGGSPVQVSDHDLTGGVLLPTVVDGSLYFVHAGQLKRMVGATGSISVLGTSTLATSPVPYYLAGFNNRLYFYAAGTDGTGTELYMASGATITRLTDRTFPTVGAGTGPTEMTGAYVMQGGSQPEPALFFKGGSDDDGSAFGHRHLYMVDKTNTAGGTRVVKYTAGIGNDSNVSAITAVGNRVFFSAADSEANRYRPQLWVSDGTSAGTVEVKVINDSSSPLITNIVALGNIAVFGATNPTFGPELWRSDGTAAGTAPIVDAAPITEGSAPSMGTWWKDRLYFTATDDDGTHLWRTDGTPANTQRVAVLRLGASDGVAHLTPAEDTLYFTADDGTSGVELWRTDGTPAGTALVKDINPGADHSKPTNLFMWQGLLFFAADNGTVGIEPWVSDGTAEGTFMLKDTTPGATSGTPEFIAAHDGKLYFVAQGTTNPVLGSTDGTVAGTVAGPTLASALTTPVYKTGSSFCYCGTGGGFGSELHCSDGSTAIRLTDVDTAGDGCVRTLTSTDTHLYIATFNGTSFGVMRTGGGGANTESLGLLPFEPIAAELFGSRLVVVGVNTVDNSLHWGVLEDQIFVPFNQLCTECGLIDSQRVSKRWYVLVEEEDSGVLWSTDGTTTANLTPVPQEDHREMWASEYGLFTWFDDYGAYGRELWWSDGTSPIQRITDLSPGRGHGVGTVIGEKNGTLYLRASDGQSGMEPWRF